MSLAEPFSPLQLSPLNKIAGHFPALLMSSPEDAAMIQSTRIRVGRNLKKYPLGPGITKEQRDEVEKTVSGVLSGLTGEHKGKYYSLATMSKED